MINGGKNAVLPSGFIRVHRVHVCPCQSIRGSMIPNPLFGFPGAAGQIRRSNCQKMARNSGEGMVIFASSWL
jgi:hypothetical protein